MPTESEIHNLLNDDLTRELQEIYAYAVFSHRFDDDLDFSEELSNRGQQAIVQAFDLGRIILDLGAEVRTNFNEEEAVSHAIEVARVKWEAETIRRLRERASHLILLGEVGLSVRLFRLIADKQARPSLETLLRKNSKGLSLLDA